ncbi:hypothetical protein RRG08_037107 [Elysia crispata]|uniref:PLAC8 family protein n=1 Tax=Elysia crispata TaxID=231223 RepID=A0AAE1CTB5_9GAST|nr:hypothetical protein RRG08_037107 [Elysia crispata]
MYSQPPPYGVNSGRGYPMTAQPQSSWAESHYVGGAANKKNVHGRPLTPPPGLVPKTVSMDPEGKANSGGSNGTTINGGNSNTNNNNNNSSSHSSIVVNANMTAGAGLGTENRLCLVGKDRLTHRDWNSGLFSCLNDAVGCVLTAACLPLAMMRLSNRLNECACVTCCVPGGVLPLRTKLRIMGGIRGSICNDCLASHFCCYCVVCQMKREMDDMKL